MKQRWIMPFADVSSLLPHFFPPFAPFVPRPRSHCEFMDLVSSLKSKGIDEDKIAEYQAAFQMFDTAGRGYFDENDLRDLLSRFSA